MAMEDNGTIEKVAFSMTRGVSPAMWQQMEQTGIYLDDFFSFETSRLADALGCMPSSVPDMNTREEALIRARKEAEFMARHNIRALFIGDDDYPWGLMDMSNSPLLLYQLGEADVNSEHSLGVVGTRRPTVYGIELTRKLIADMAGYFPDVTIVSGLAFGIDVAAHLAALEAERPTIAVVAHGLHMIYPAAHRDIAGRIVRQGGAILSEYPSGSTPFRNRFLERNRIVACICKALFVAESDIRGGAMSTAHDAFSWGRDVFALPGRAGDTNSRGTNHLIRRHKAELVTCAADIIESLGWEPAGVKVDARQRCLFPELEGDNKRIYDILRIQAEPMSLDILHAQTRLPVAELMAALSEMEFDGIVARLPGNRFTVIG